MQQGAVEWAAGSTAGVAMPPSRRIFACGQTAIARFIASKSTVKARQRHRDGSRPADLDDAIDTATIGQLTGLRVPVRRLGVVDHVRGAQSLPYPGGGSFRPPNQSKTA